jgi:hypothetical protein
VVFGGGRDIREGERRCVLDRTCTRRSGCCLLRCVCWVSVGISETLLRWKDFGQAVKGAVWRCGEVGCRVEFTCLLGSWVCYVVVQGSVIGGVDDAVVRYSVRRLGTHGPVMRWMRVMLEFGRIFALPRWRRGIMTAP